MKRLMFLAGCALNGFAMDEGIHVGP